MQLHRINDASPAALGADEGDDVLDADAHGAAARISEPGDDSHDCNKSHRNKPAQVLHKQSCCMKDGCNNRRHKAQRHTRQEPSLPAKAEPDGCSDAEMKSS